MKKKFFVIAAIFMVLISLTTVSLYSFIPVRWAMDAQDCMTWCLDTEAVSIGTSEARHCAMDCMYGKGY